MTRDGRALTPHALHHVVTGDVRVEVAAVVGGGWGRGVELKVITADGLRHS